MSAGACTVHCGRLAAVLDLDARRTLEYIARWRADLAYISEHWGVGDPEAEISRRSIEFGLEDADRRGLPYWLQNAALQFGEDWRRYKSTDLFSWLSGRGYQVIFD